MVQQRRAPLLGKVFQTRGARGFAKALLLDILTDALHERIERGKLAGDGLHFAGNEGLILYGKWADLFSVEPFRGQDAEVGQITRLEVGDREQPMECRFGWIQSVYALMGWHGHMTYWPGLGGLPLNWRVTLAGESC